MPFLFVDVDLTVLDFVAKWEPFLVENGVHLPEPGFLKGHCRLTDALGMDVALETELLNKFFDSSAFYDLPAIEGAPEALQALYRHDWRFVAVTACPNGKGVSEARRGNLEAVLGVPFEEVYTTGIGGCKRDILASFTPTVFVEDNFENALIGQELGYQTFLISQKHNLHHDAPMIRVDHWSEIVDQLVSR